MYERAGGVPTRHPRRTNTRKHKHTHAHANSHTWRATHCRWPYSHCRCHGLRRSRPSPVIAEGATLVAALVATLVEDEAAKARVHVRWRAVKALRAVVLTHAEPHKHRVLVVVVPRMELSLCSRLDVAAWAACFLALSFFGSNMYMYLTRRSGHVFASVNHARTCLVRDTSSRWTKGPSLPRSSLTSAC